MSFELTQERLQSIAVKCVASYMNKQASLSGAIAKEAQELELNPEQIKRVIETTNTVAYLRQLEDAKDRTFEFPVADYSHVMGEMCIPEKTAEEKKEDEEKDKKKEDKSEDEEKEEKSEDEEKEEKSEDKEVPPQFSEQEKKAMLLRESIRCKGILEKIACDKVGLQLEIENAAIKLRNDSFGLEKLAEVVAEEDFDKMLKLCGIEKRASANLVFTDKELLSARRVYDLYKEAKAMVEKEAELEDFVKRAFLPAMAGGLARLAGSAIAAPVKAVGKGIGQAVMNPSSRPGKITRAIGIGGVINAATAPAAINHNQTVWNKLQG